LFVRTIKGDLDPGTLGFTHCHDHLFVFKTEQTQLPENLLLNSYDKTKNEVLRFIEKGERCVLDAQPFGAGRHASLLERLCRETEIDIVPSTGLHKSTFYKPDFWSFNAHLSEIADLFISEIEEGMYDYDYYDSFRRRSVIRAGAIKIAIDEQGLTEKNKKVFKAAIIAHKKTGAPILTHTELSKWGLEQAKYLIAGGVPRQSIIISHMDRVINISKHIEVAQLGVFLAYDTIVRSRYHSDEEEVLMLKTMIQNGFCNQIVIGMDSTRERFLTYGGPIGLDFILSHFMPMLIKVGISEENIDTITVKNPQTALSFKRK